jgi:hypothetical protein
MTWTCITLLWLKRFWFHHMLLTCMVARDFLHFRREDSIQHYVIKFVSDLWQVSGFLRILPFVSTSKTYRHDITEIMLKVALSTINLTPCVNSTYKMKVLYYYFFSVSRSSMLFLNIRTKLLKLNLYRVPAQK